MDKAEQDKKDAQAARQKAENDLKVKQEQAVKKQKAAHAEQASKVSRQFNQNNEDNNS